MLWKRVGLAISIALTSTAAIAQSGFLVEKRVYDNGNSEIEIFNRSDTGADIYSVRINRSSLPECTLAPVRSDYGDTLIRSDAFSNPNLVQLDFQQPIDAVSLPFGGTVIALAPRSCGRVLEAAIETETGSFVVSWDR
jgi:hypothetical protein